MFARVPASSANLGPGFDTLAVALTLYVEVSLEPADTLSIVSDGCGAGRFDDERHLGVQVASGILGHTNFSMRVTSTIPLSRGLGSSAALAVAAAAAAGALDPLAEGTRVDGHAENAAASMLGGLVVASVDPVGGVTARQLPLDDSWRFVVVVPDLELDTAEARQVLPTVVPFLDAVHNLNAMGLLIAGLANHHEFVGGAMDDYLHQPYRSQLLDYAAPLLSLLRESGAAGSCWSGSGSTMLGLVTNETAQDVALAAKEFLHERSIRGDVHVLDADRTGLVLR
ncbi:MAG TPA: homoserine kinase [Acidimicrobiales bacterium]|jgi:homoserine kinase|nr:homoserine kinase [Acidimicrobiales bacterium]